MNYKIEDDRAVKIIEFFARILGFKELSSGIAPHCGYLHIKFTASEIALKEVLKLSRMIHAHINVLLNEGRIEYAMTLGNNFDYQVKVLEDYFSLGQ